MACTSQTFPHELVGAEKATNDAPSKSCSSCCALKVKHPGDIIQIFQADDGVADAEATRFWTGSQADENLLARGSYVLVEIQNRSNLICKTKHRRSTEGANPKLLIPIHTAERIGFSRLASVGPVVQKTDAFTFTMEKVDTEEACKGSTALHFNNQIFRLDTQQHESGCSEQAPASSARSPSTWSNMRTLSVRSLRELFSFKMLFVVLLGRYGLAVANEKYQFLQNDLIKLWMNDAYAIAVDCLYRLDETPTLWETLWSQFFKHISI